MPKKLLTKERPKEETSTKVKKRIMGQSDDAIQFYLKATDAVEHLDAFSAYQAYKVFDENATLLLSQYRNDPEFKNDLAILKTELRYVALPELPQAEAEKILSSEIIPFIRSGMDLNERLAVRAAFIPYGEGENEQRLFKQAILKNKEMIGEWSIGEWLLAFDKAFPPLKRSKQTIVEFLTHQPKVSSISRFEHEVLRMILLGYENWIATGRLNIYDVAYLQKQGKKYEVGAKVESSPAKNFPQESRPLPSRTMPASLIQLPLLQALSKYDQLGNQLITNDRIKVKSQAEPVRPSLLYWLKYYRDELGIGHHDSVQRGEFLFRSENGRKLSPEERERLNLILKSVEENMPLSINTGTSEIVFPRFEAPVERPPQQFVPPLAFEPKKAVVEVPKPERIIQPVRSVHFDERKESVATEKGTISFSSTHIFPAEKEKALLKTPTEKSNPFHIRPVSVMRKDEDDEIMGDE